MGWVLALTSRQSMSVVAAPSSLQPWNVAQIGRLLSKGELTFNRIFALTGPAIRHPHYYSTTLGMDVSRAFDHNLSEEHARIISGNVLTGADVGDYVTPRFYDAQLTLLPSGISSRICACISSVVRQ